MAVTRTLTKQIVRLKLNNGTSPTTGQVLTVNQSMPALTTEANGYSDSKVVDVIDSLVPCLTKSVYATEYVGTYTLVD